LWVVLIILLTTPGVSFLDEKRPAAFFFLYFRHPLSFCAYYTPPRSRPGTETDDEDHAFRDFAIERDEILSWRGKNSTREWIIIIGCVM
jgi:hypothetical protein